jgi:hypothetical protein
MNIDRALSLRIGEEIHHSMSVWGESLRPLASLLGPFTRTGQVRPLLCASDGKWVTLSWYEGPDDPNIPSVVAEALNRPTPAWPTTVSFGVGEGQFWALEKCKKLIVSSLTDLIKQREIPTNDEGLLSERLWRTALAIGGFGSLFDKPIEIASLQARLATLSGTVVFGWPTNTVRVNVDEFKASLFRLEGTLGAFLMPPFPPRDLAIQSERVTIWDEFSEPQLMRRVIHTFSGALAAYETICNDWLSALRQHMPRWLMMPARLNGSLMPGNKQRPPALDYYLEPLPRSESNAVEIQLSSAFPPFEEIVNDVSGKIKKLRPLYEGRLGVTRTQRMLDIFGRTPVTDLTYEWLTKDLKSIDWVN